MNPIYLDNAATTPLSPEVRSVLSECYHEIWANPASQHAAGRHAHAAVEDAKDRLKSVCLNDVPKNQHHGWQVLITSGGTEANNLALSGLAPSEHSPIFIGATEHPSIYSLVSDHPHFRMRCQILPVDRLGAVNIDALDRMLMEQEEKRERAPLVSLQWANNETGILLDIKKISSVCHARGALLHTDLVQALGKIPLPDLSAMVDAFTISAHKIHGPVGIGALFVRPGVTVRPLLYGGGQQLGLRPGTESVPLVCAFAAAGDHMEDSLRAMRHVSQMREHFESSILAADPLAVVIGQQSPRLPHISMISFRGLDRQAMLMALDMVGIQCSSGSACASGSSQPSHVLVAMGLEDDIVRGAIRFSLSRYTTALEIDSAIERVSNVISRLRRQS